MEEKTQNFNEIHAMQKKIQLETRPPCTCFMTFTSRSVKKQNYAEKKSQFSKYVKQKQIHLPTC
jgi:hypothetical protein